VAVSTCIDQQMMESQGSQNSELIGSKRTAFSMALQSLGEVEKPGEDPERTAGDWDAMRPFSPVFFFDFCLATPQDRSKKDEVEPGFTGGS